MAQALDLRNMKTVALCSILYLVLRHRHQQPRSLHRRLDSLLLTLLGKWSHIWRAVREFALPALPSVSTSDVTLTDSSHEISDTTLLLHRTTGDVATRERSVSLQGIGMRRH
jgi:hypothetical protein